MTIDDDEPRRPSTLNSEEKPTATRHPHNCRLNGCCSDPLKLNSPRMAMRMPPPQNPPSFWSCRQKQATAAMFWNRSPHLNGQN